MSLGADADRIDVPDFAMAPGLLITARSHLIGVVAKVSD